MDDVLLRRLVGAAVLLAAAFALASLLPDPGPAATAGGRSFVTYDLRTGKPISAPPDPARRATGQETASLRRPALKVDESLGDVTGSWYVQVGSFESQANARNVLQKLYGLGLPTVIQSVSVGKALWYRVRVGPYPAEDAAQQALATIRQQGYASAKLVRPESAPPGGRN